jgi:hypothetical protein
MHSSVAVKLSFNIEDQVAWKERRRIDDTANAMLQQIDCALDKFSWPV